MKRVSQKRQCYHLSWLAFILSASICIAQQSERAQPAPSHSRYPDRVLEALGGLEPFNPNDISIIHKLPMKALIDGRIGVYGLTVDMEVEGLGKKALLLDTAARGLVLKSKTVKGEEVIRAPEWVGSGPGIRTGVFRIFPALSRERLRLAPAVAEIFWEKGFQWVDGILATEIFDPWIVRLNFRDREVLLLPRSSYTPMSAREWPSKLERNWWFVETEIQGKSAWLLLDSGAARTHITMRWLRGSSVGRVPPPTGAGAGLLSQESFEAGECSIAIKDNQPLRRPILGVEDERVPALPGIRCEGLLGIDVIKTLALDLDYKAGKLYLLARTN